MLQALASSVDAGSPIQGLGGEVSLVEGATTVSAKSWTQVESEGNARAKPTWRVSSTLLAAALRSGLGWNDEEATGRRPSSRAPL